MRRKYPKREDVTCLICDQVRPELHNKISVMGWYSGNRIVFEPKVPGEFPYVLAGLSFVYMAINGSGEFDCRFRLIDPDDNQVNDVEMKTVVMAAGRQAGIIVQLAPVQFNSDGTYKAVLSLNSREYEFEFNVSSVESGLDSV